VHTVENRPECYEEEKETEEISATSARTNEEKKEETPAECDWDETKSPDGYTYYWHKVTGGET
jgi:hypothetical protein